MSEGNSVKQRIVFACTGTAGNLAAMSRLASALDADIVALTLDVGQSAELEGVRQAALTAGAVRAHVLDARDAFARHCIAASLDEETSSAITNGHVVARPLIARKLIEIARIEGAAVIAHSGDHDDHAGIEAAARSIDPAIRVIAAPDGVALDVAPGVDSTPWERSPEDVARAANRSLNEPARLEIAFEGGFPVSVNGVPMTLTEVIESVATIAEAPAAVVFHAAHGALGAHASRAAGATVCLELFKGQHRVLSAQHS